MTEHNGVSKKQRVGEMFDAIAPTYDALNHILSLGIDREWRRKVVKMVAGFREKRPSASLRSSPNSFLILDVATGTGDLAIALARRMPQVRVTGVDISENMLAEGREKLAGFREKRAATALRSTPDSSHTSKYAADRAPSQALYPPVFDENRQFWERVALRTGDAEALDFADGAFDGVTVAFGVRNFGDIPVGLAEMYRVLRPGGRCWVLEFSEPRTPVFGAVYRFYFHRVLPWLGRVVSKDRAAYSYLPRSVDGFPSPPRFSQMLREAGFADVRTKKLTFGVAYIYEAEK